MFNKSAFSHSLTELVPQSPWEEKRNAYCVKEWENLGLIKHGFNVLYYILNLNLKVFLKEWEKLNLMKP